MIQIIIKLINKLSYLFYIFWNKLKFKYAKGIYVKDIKSLKIVSSIYLRIKKNGKILIGKDLNIISGLCYNPITRNIKTSLFVEKDASITIGNNVGISGACIWAHKNIIIGNNVKIGGDSIIIDSDCHSLDFLKRRGKQDQKYKISKEIIIKDDVLIGTRCIILKGVTIGEKSIIGAGSIVVKDIPSNCIAAGNPCRVLKYLN